MEVDERGLHWKLINVVCTGSWWARFVLEADKRGSYWKLMNAIVVRTRTRSRWASWAANVRSLTPLNISPKFKMQTLRSGSAARSSDIVEGILNFSKVENLHLRIFEDLRKEPRWLWKWRSQGSLGSKSWITKIARRVLAEDPKDHRDHEDLEGSLGS